MDYKEYFRMESKDYFGSKPRMDLTKQVDTSVFGNVKLKTTGVNYTNDENFWNYLPILGAWENRFIQTSTGDYTFGKDDLDKLVASFDPIKLLPVDVNHKMEEAVGYVLDVKAFNGDLITYTSDGKAVTMDKPEGGGVLMMKIGLNDKGQALIREGKDVYPSAVWTKDGQLGSPTLCIDPADNLMPAIVMAATKGGNMADSEKKDEVKVKREALSKFFATKQEKNLVFKAIDSASPSYQPLLDFIAKMTEEDAVMLLDILNQQFTPAPVEAKDPLTAEQVVEIVTKAIDDKLKPQATDAKPDEGELAARLEYLAAGYPAETINKEASMLKGVKPEDVKTTLKARFSRIQSFNSKSAIKDEVTPETLMAKGLSPSEAFKQARELQKGA